MRILCCLDGNNIEQMNKAISMLLSAETRTIGVLYVTDTEPHERMELQRERLLRPSPPPLPVRQQMRQAEEALAQEILEEGNRVLGGAEMLQRTGRPEREIVFMVEEWQADIVVVASGKAHGGGKPLGPKSMGHVARFVLDHAPCAVLLMRDLPD
jgi:nucleotide-binding universal stress UspA family protein